MRYATAAAFRQALDDRLKAEAAKTGLGIARLRKRVAFELFLRRLVTVAPDRWVLKGALALDFRFHATARPTRDMDLGRAGDEDAAVEDLAAAQELVLDDFFTFAARRTDALDDADDFKAIRFHVTAELAGRVFDQFVVDVGFADPMSYRFPSTSPRRSTPTRGSTACPAARAPDRRISSTSSSSPDQSGSTPPLSVTPSTSRSGNANSSRCRQACHHRPRGGESPIADWPRRWMSSRTWTKRSRPPPSFSIRSSPDAPTANGPLHGEPGRSPPSCHGGRVLLLRRRLCLAGCRIGRAESGRCASASDSGACVYETSGGGVRQRSRIRSISGRTRSRASPRLAPLISSSS